jgi:asparagine synthase (glutamine-hydrolysing)
MYCEICLTDFSFDYKNLYESNKGGITMLVSSEDHRLNSIFDLKTAEYMQAIGIDVGKRTVLFGRDYLGHYPLLFILNDQKLFISDDIDVLLEKSKIKPTISKKSLALYLSMGYVPQGLTLFDEIKSCRNASIYSYQDGTIRHQELFKEIEQDSKVGAPEMAKALSDSVASFASHHSQYDVWCSGGIDSSVIAQLATDSNLCERLLTIYYDNNILKNHGDGEYLFSKMMADHCHRPLEVSCLDEQTYRNAFIGIASNISTPVIEPCITAKYALASITRNAALTGEGGDCLFAGAKNNYVLYNYHCFPDISLSSIYAESHNRFYSRLDEFLVDGKYYQNIVEQYFDNIFDKYPEDLTSKLFYLNTFEKQGGLIFLESYYAGKKHGKEIFSPISSLLSYETAFKLPNQLKYDYPEGKLILKEIYRELIPSPIINREKSGTHIPLSSFCHYIKHTDLPNFERGLERLSEAGVFRQDILDRICSVGMLEHNLTTYAIYSLITWLGQRRYSYGRTKTSFNCCE